MTVLRRCPLCERLRARRLDTHYECPCGFVWSFEFNQLQEDIHRNRDRLYGTGQRR